MLPSLVAHAVGCEMVISAHNIVYVQTHLAGSTVFAWYSKRQRPQYCLCPDASGKLYRVHLVRQTLMPTTLFMSKRIRQALPCSPGTANVGAYNTVCALTHL